MRMRAQGREWFDGTYSSPPGLELLGDRLAETQVVDAKVLTDAPASTS